MDDVDDRYAILGLLKPKGNLFYVLAATLTAQAGGS